MNPYPRDIQQQYNPEENVNVFQASRLTGFAPKTLNKMRCYGGGPAFLKLGKKVVYEVAELRRWLRQRSL